MAISDHSTSTTPHEATTKSRAVLIFHADAGAGEHDEGELRSLLAANGIEADPCAVDAAAIRIALASGHHDLAVVAGDGGTVALAIAVAAASASAAASRILSPDGSRGTRPRSTWGWRDVRGAVAALWRRPASAR